MPGKGLLEVGYVFHKASNLYQGLDLNQVPFFMVSGGQSFAQAFDALAKEIKAGSAITPQPFLETSLAGSSFCGSGSCTAGVVSKFGGSITSQQLRSVFDGIQQDFVFGPVINTLGQGFAVGGIVIGYFFGILTFSIPALQGKTRTGRAVDAMAAISFVQAPTGLAAVVQ